MTARTAEASTVHQPFGKPSGPGLFHVKGLQLPAYIQHVAHELVKKGRPESQAIQMAVGIIKNWARGGGGVKPDVVAAAQKALAEWEAAKAKAHALSNRQEAIELAQNNWAEWDKKHPRGSQYGGEQAKDSEGLSERSKQAVAQAYKNRDEKNAKDAAKKSAAEKLRATKKAAGDKARADKKAASDSARQGKKDAADALRLAAADKKAGKKLTPQQEKRLQDAAKSKKDREAKLRNLSNSGKA